jgi:hypothetical protein
MLQANPQQNTKNLLIALGVVGLILCVLITCVFSGVFSLFPSEPKTVDDYMKEYGGNPDVYQRILTSTDCTVLQKEFDQADANMKSQLPGTPQYKWGIGYMNAADNKMKEIGCYK